MAPSGARVPRRLARPQAMNSRSCHLLTQSFPLETPYTSAVYLSAWRPRSGLLFLWRFASPAICNRPIQTYGSVWLYTSAPKEGVPLSLAALHPCIESCVLRVSGIATPCDMPPGSGCASQSLVSGSSSLDKWVAVHNEALPAESLTKVHVVLAQMRRPVLLMCTRCRSGDRPPTLNFGSQSRGFGLCRTASSEVFVFGRLQLRNFLACVLERLKRRSIVSPSSMLRPHMPSAFDPSFLHMLTSVRNFDADITV